MGIKSMMMKKLMERQLKDVPAAQRDQLMAMVEKNPDLFMKIAEETKARVKNGANQMSAMMAVSKKYEKELRALAGPQIRR